MQWWGSCSGACGRPKKPAWGDTPSVSLRITPPLWNSATTLTSQCHLQLPVSGGHLFDACTWHLSMLKAPSELINMAGLRNALGDLVAGTLWRFLGSMRRFRAFL